MKTILLAAAAAFAFVTPAAAQPQQGQQHPANHGQHQGHGQQGHARHQGHGQSHGAQHAQHGQGQHQDHSQHANCCGDANGNGRMDCCEGANAAQRPCCAHHQQHGQQAPRPAPAQPNDR